MTQQAVPAPSGALRATLERGEFVVAPGVYKMFGARIADRRDLEDVQAFERRRAQ